MHTTMSFLTTTSAIASELPAQPPAPRLEVVGYDRAAGRIVLREHVGGEVTTAVLATTGARAGSIISLAPGARVPGRSLIALVPAPLAGWDLTTRVIQRRGLRVFGDLAPIRKFALALTVQQRMHGVAVARGRIVATAYLRPRAALSTIWVVPGEPLAVAVVSYCGVPTGVGVDKEIAVLAAPSWQ